VCVLRHCFPLVELEGQIPARPGEKLSLGPSESAESFSYIGFFDIRSFTQYSLCHWGYEHPVTPCTSECILFEGGGRKYCMN
jgi:hypothetical protein